MKCMKKQHCKNLVASYIIGCVLAIICVICSDCNNFDSNEFKFGLYLFSFCQIFIWEPLSVCVILLIHKIGILPHILDNIFLCILYAILPSLLMLADAFFDVFLIKHFNVGSIIVLIPVKTLFIILYIYFSYSNYT